MLNIRKYENRDFADYAATLEKTTSFGKDAKTELERMLAKAGKESVWVGEVEGKPVGFMTLTTNADGSLEIDWLDVHPDFQRMGIGTSLVKKAVEVAQTKGGPHLTIHTQVGNDKMLKAAIKNGFEIVERLPNYYGEGKTALLLKKRIKH